MHLPFPPPPRRSQQAVFVADKPGARMTKIAYGLQENGWEVVLLHRDPLHPEDRAFFSEVHRYAQPLEALFLAANFSPAVYHVFASWDFETAFVLMRLKPGKMVFDNYDMLEGMIRPSILEKHPPPAWKAERFCYENADGICCRCLESNHLKRHRGLRIRGRRIFFPDYCWDRPSLAESRPLDPADGVHVVHAGFMDLEKFHPPGKFREGFMLDLAKGFAAAGVHFHIYPSNHQDDFENAFSDFLELEARSPFFHMHRPLPYQRLVPELSRYHYGIYALADARNLAEGDEATTPERYYYALGNKVFDFIDAGLDIVHYGFATVDFLARRYGFGVTASKADAPRVVPALPRERSFARRQGLVRARRDFSVARNIPRLIEFYGSL